MCEKDTERSDGLLGQFQIEVRVRKESRRCQSLGDIIISETRLMLLSVS